MAKTDILDSRIKKVLIELPHYSFSHSSTEKSPHFVGRVQIRQKLIKLIESTIDKTGVYLVTGNRGVGKTSLVSEVIGQTSLQRNSNFFCGLRYFFILLFSVAVTQYCFQRFELSVERRLIISAIFGIPSFLLLCYFNDYRRKISKHSFWGKLFELPYYIGSIIKVLVFVPYYTISIIKVSVLLPNFRSRYRRRLFCSNIILIVCLTQIFSIIVNRIFYKNIAIVSWLSDRVVGNTPTTIFLICSIIILLLMFVVFFINKVHEHKIKELTGNSYFYSFKSLFKSIENLAKNSNRVYLRINFGHKLKDEKDILRLITRTLTTEYSKYRRSLWRIFFWRVTALIFLLLSAYLFSSIIKEQEFYKLIKSSNLHQASSQVFFNDTNDTIRINDSRYVKINDSLYYSIIENDTISIFYMDMIRLRYAFSNDTSSSKRLRHTSSSNTWFSNAKNLQRDQYRLKMSTETRNYNFSKPETFLLVIDQLVFEISKRVKSIPQYLLKDEKKLGISPINYLFWLSLFLIYLFCILLFRSDWFSRHFVTHRSIKQRLKRLNEDITHSTERESSMFIGSGISKGGVLGTKQKKIRSIADAREIEKKLQDIFNDIQQIPIFMGRPDFVIVFDELDKVEPDKTESNSESGRTKASMFSIDTARERQTEILTILSNMKYFLSTANAKFIFIAGREMYDIYLADVSERTNYIGSIFNVVIYVPSFLSDQPGLRRTGITTLTEEFVCRRLIPHDYTENNGRYDLKEYQNYLKGEIFKEENNKLEHKSENQHKIEKTIAILQQLIVYLAHVSKGSPKKIMQLFESFIKDYEDIDGQHKNSLVVQRYDRSKLFLAFGYYEQYSIGIVAYLMTPIFNRLSQGNIKDHSDKLLVSSLRFVDFLFKFHKDAFSWKHLDISPEMLEFNRSPELKSVISDLLNYLTKVHINRSTFGLCEFRFDSLIANEIFVMTKTDETFSALFSFSLDETLSQKKFYEDLLKKEEAKYKDRNYFQEKESPRFIDSISSLHVVLGDLHFYDDELEEAGVYYKNAVQMIRDQKPISQEKGAVYETMTLEQLYIYTRNMLRLGMIYEKREQYDNAYLAYGELCKRIIREREITIRELKSGIVLRYDKKNNVNVFVKTADVKEIGVENENYYDNIAIAEKEHHVKCVSENIAKPQPLTFQSISPNTNDMLFKKITFEGLKLLYLPFIAKLQILEKSHVGGITPNHLDYMEKEFKQLTFIIDHNEAKILEAEFFSRVADILYYKNLDLKSRHGKSRQDDEDENKIKADDNQEKNTDHSCCINRDLHLNCNFSTFEKKEDKNNDNGKPDENEEKIENYSCTACHYYHKSLCRLLNIKKSKSETEINENATLTEILTESIKQNYDNCDVKFCTTLARILSDWGNVFFSCDKVKKNCGCGDECHIYGNKAKDCNTIKIPTWCKPNCGICNPEDCNVILCVNNLKVNTGKYFDYIKSESELKHREALTQRFEKNKHKPLSKFEIAFAMYSISLHAYRKSTRYKRAAFQVYKMLCMFRTYEIYRYIDLTMMDEYVDKLSRRAINYLWYASEDLNTFELNKHKKTFNKETIDDTVPLQNLLVGSEICRITLLVKELRLKAVITSGDSQKKYEVLKKYYNMYITSPYAICYNVSTRIYQLRLKAMVNYEAYRMLIKKYTDNSDIELKHHEEIYLILTNKNSTSVNYTNESTVSIFGEYLGIKKSSDVTLQIKLKIVEELIAETIFCLKEIIRLSKTIGASYLFNHSFVALKHKKLSYWVRLYEVYKRGARLYKKFEDKKKNNCSYKPQIDKLLKNYIGEEYTEQLSGYYENQQALQHYYKCKETHNEGRAYHEIINNMYFIKDDYNDRSDHFNNAEERHKLLNGEIDVKINKLKERYKESELHKVDSYFEKI